MNSIKSATKYYQSLIEECQRFLNPFHSKEESFCNNIRSKLNNKFKKSIALSQI
jgi:hypothetical protein